MRTHDKWKPKRRKRSKWRKKVKKKKHTHTQKIGKLFSHFIQSRYDKLAILLFIRSMAIWWEYFEICRAVFMFSLYRWQGDEGICSSDEECVCVSISYSYMCMCVCKCYDYQIQSKLIWKVVNLYLSDKKKANNLMISRWLRDFMKLHRATNTETDTSIDTDIVLKVHFWMLTLARLPATISNQI